MLFSTQEALSTALDPYYSVLRSYQPYQEVGFSVRQDLSARIGAEAGLWIRRLKRSRDVGPFNHEFERYYTVLTVRDWPFTGSEIAVTGNAYDTGSDAIWEIEGAFRQELGPASVVEVGSGYALFDEDRFTFEERNNIRTGFVRFDHAIIEALSARAEYAVENDDADTTHRVEVGVRLRF
jgi:hypothetical protein